MPEIVLRVGGYAPRDSSHSAGLEAFSDRVETASDGRIEVVRLWNVLDQGRPATDLLEMVERGELLLCYFSTSYLGDRVPELNVLETPYLFDDLDRAHRALDGALGAVLTSAVEERTGFRLLGFWDNGFRHLTNRVKPIRRPADCAGLRVRLQPNGLHEAMVAAWGGVPVPVELGRGIEMIERGEVDAQENPLANTVAYGVDRFHRFVTMTAHLYGARGLFAHPGTLGSLDEEDQRLVEEAARDAILHQRRSAAVAEGSLRTRLEAGGLAFVDLTPEERAAFKDASTPVMTRARNELDEALFELACGA